ncbi:MAG: Uma2 family endonuclease [Byssovorax sp.]
MDASPTRPPRDTGPLELRDFGPMGRRLGTPEDCYDGSPWELHRGELVEQMGSKDIHGITMALFAALFRTHARDGLTVMTDVYCDLSDAAGPSLRAPDVVLVRDLSIPRNEAYHGTPILAVEVRGTQSKRYLEEKVKLYVEHDWPTVWIAHAERREVEVVTPGMASVTYRLGTEVPFPAELDKYGLRAVPVAAFFDDRETSRFNDGWVGARGEARGEAKGRAQAILDVLDARKIGVAPQVSARIAACTELALLERWLVHAATCADAAEFARAID